MKLDEKRDRNTYKIESDVRSYCHSFPAEFISASNSNMVDRNGNIYIDFLCGCGSLNYGHNHVVLREALVKHIQNTGIAISMDLHTEAKSKFLEAFSSLILKPRGLDYRLQFTGPTGTNAVEAAIKLARKLTGRTNIIAFTNGYHGCTLGALSLTGSNFQRNASSALLNGVSHMPYDNYFGQLVNTADLLEKMLDDCSSGIDEPAAIILETIQGEGGLNTATSPWIQKIFSTARKHGALLIIDDIQAGCGRSGHFFSFEPFGITPDIVTLSKSLSGFGLPMSLVLVRPEYDIWKSGEHNGTFRGNNHAFVTATAALEHFWSDDSFQSSIQHKAQILSDGLERIAERFGFTVKGRGLMQGISFASRDISKAVSSICYKRGLILETCGPEGEVLKLLPPLTIEEDELLRGLQIIEESLNDLGHWFLKGAMNA